MNNILRYKGFRFYQSDYDQDLRGSILSVSHDPWGIALSYIGYFLMFFSMLFILFEKRERFRYLLKKLAQKPAMLVPLLFIPLSGNAAESLLTRDTLTVSVQQAEQLGSLQVDYHGRICPVQTLANDFTAKLTGKTRYKYASGEQVFFGWIFFPEKWKRVMMFEVKNDELKRIINSSGTACFDDFFEPNGQYKLQPYLRGTNRSKSFAKEVSKLNDKIQLLYGMIVNGYLLNFFPLPDANGKIQWYTPNAALPFGTVPSDSVFVRQFLVDYKKALLENAADAAIRLIDRMSVFRHEKAGVVLPSDTHLKIEKAYNRLHIFSLLFKICLGIGSIALLYFIFGTICGKNFPRAVKVFYGLLWLAFIVATVGLGMRAYIGGRLPLSNGYETLLLLAWLSLLTGVLSRRYSFLIVVFGFMLSGFTLLVAHIGSMDPQITPLMPVLQSPLLSIHVLTIMMAYGLCGFMTLNSLTALIVRIIGGNRQDQAAYTERMKETCELFMYPATFLMGTGIFIGAIWANMSWGRYWGWDPKEVWALITFMLMSFTFHGKTLKWFRNPVFYHIFVLVIFLAVLMTYFGVNYILGGRHSYAG